MLAKQKTWKRALAALGIAFILLRLLPMVITAVLSFTDIDVKGHGSWTGLKNYIDTLTSTTKETYWDSDTRVVTVFNLFFRALKNTLVLGVLSGALTAMISGLLIWCLVRLPKRTQTVILTVLAIPALIPSSFFAGLIIDMTASYGLLGNLIQLLQGDSFNLLARPEWSRVIVIIGDVFRTTFYPTLVGVMTIKDRDGRKIAGLAVCWLLLRVTVLSDSFTDNILQIYNPLVYSTTDTLGTFSYRRGFQEGKYHLSFAMDSLRYLATALAAVPVMKLAEGTCRLEQKTPSSDGSRAAIVLAAVLMLPFVALCLFILHFSLGGLPELWRAVASSGVNPKEFVAITGEYWFSSLSNSVLFSTVYALYSGIVALTVGYVILRKGSKSLAIALLCCLPGTIWSCVIPKVLGVSYFSLQSSILRLLFLQCFSTGVPVLGAMGLARHLKSRSFGGFRDYLQTSAPAITVICLAAFCTRYGFNREDRYWPSTTASCTINYMIFTSFVEYDASLPNYLAIITDSLGNSLTMYTGDPPLYDIVARVWAFVGSLPPIILGLIPVVLRDKLPAELMCSGIRR